MQIKSITQIEIAVRSDMSLVSKTIFRFSVYIQKPKNRKKLGKKYTKLSVLFV